MHTTEAYMAASDALNDPLWAKRALMIADFAVNQSARANNWRLIEHFDVNWNPLPDYNKEFKAHPFRPYGTTPGHGFEWSRLTPQLHQSLKRLGCEAPHWLLEGSTALFDRAREDGWVMNPSPGFVYTVDYDCTPIVQERIFWVICEAISAAAASYNAAHFGILPADRLGEYAQCYSRWLDHAEEHFIERSGVWTHELSAHNQPSSITWHGRSDIYHALQCVLISRLPIVPSIPFSLKAGLLDSAGR